MMHLFWIIRKWQFIIRNLQLRKLWRGHILTPFFVSKKTFQKSVSKSERFVRIESERSVKKTYKYLHFI